MPEFENRLQHDRVSEMNEKEITQYVSFAAETEFRQNYFQRDVKAGKRNHGNHFKPKMQNVQPLSLLPFDNQQ